MKSVKFVSNDGPLFAIALKNNIQNYFKDHNLSTKGNLGMAVKTMVMLSLYLVPFILVLTIPMHAIALIVMALLMAIGMAGTGMAVAHDAIHGATSSKPWLNKLMGHSMYLVGGSVFTWKIQHNILHHTFTNLKGFDEDIETKAIIRFSRFAPMKKIYRFQHIYTFFFYMLSSLNRLGNDFRQLLRYNRKGITRTQRAKPAIEMLRLAAFKCLYLFICLGLPIWLTGYNPWMILLTFIVMHLVAGAITSIIFQVAHIVEEAKQPAFNVDGNIDNEWAIHELTTTANFSNNNWLLTWYTGSLNFQIEHHLFPHICHIHYKALSPIVEKTAKEFGLPYNRMPSLFRAVLSHVAKLKSLGRQTALS